MKVAGLIILGGLLTFVAIPAPRDKSPCTLIAAQVISMDANGDMHMLTNLEQIVTAGEIRSTKLDLEKTKDGKVEARVTWPSFPSDPTPAIDLVLSAGDENQNSSVQGSAPLEKLLWDSLFGPEPFKSKHGSTVQLGELGYVFAVAGVAPIECVTSKD